MQSSLTIGECQIGDRKGTAKKLCDKDFAERSGELSVANCLTTLLLLDNDLVAPSNCSIGGALKERRNGRAGKRSSKHLRMANKRLSTKSPQLDSPKKIHTYWIKATCDSRLCVLDVSEQRTYALELTDGLPIHGPSYQGLKICVSSLSSLFGTEHGALPWRQGWTPRNTAKRSAKEIQGKNPQFFGQSFRTGSVLSKALPMDSPKGRNGLSVLLVDCPFYWKIAFGEIFCSPTDDFGGSKMRGCCLGRILVGVPVFALGVCVSTFDRRFLAVGCEQSHLNKTPSRTAIKLCARCTLEECC